MKIMLPKSGLLVIVGLLVGIVGVQLLWPVVGQAQGGGGGPKFNLQTNLVNMEAEVPTFLPSQADTSPGRLDKLSKAFGMNGRAQGQGVLGLDEGGKSLRLRGSDGSLGFRNNNKPAPPGQANLPTQAQAGNAADKFCADNELLPPGAQRTATEVLTRQQQNGQGGGISSQQSEVMVTYGFKLDNKSAEGPGAKAQLTMGAGGEITSFSRSMPNTNKSVNTKTKSAQQAFTELQQMQGWSLVRQGGGLASINITHMHAAYWVEDPGRGGGNRVGPSYIFSGKAICQNGEQLDFMQQIDATAGGPPKQRPNSPPQPPRQ